MLGTEAGITAQKEPSMVRQRQRLGFRCRCIGLRYAEAHFSGETICTPSAQLLYPPRHVDVAAVWQPEVIL